MNDRTVGVIELDAMGLGIARILRRHARHVHACDVRGGVAAEEGP